MVPLVGDRKKASILMLILFFSSTLVTIDPVHCDEKFTSETQFCIPEYDSFISFATGGSYSNASLIDNIWYFTDLILEGATSSIDDPFFSGIRFSVSAQNSNIFFTRLDALNVYPPSSGWIEYTVSGAGNQQINLNYSHPEWLNYTVYIDDEEKAQNNGWIVTNDGWITINGATSNVKILYERASGTFTPLDTFNIPEYNSSINFAFDGTFVYTTFKNNTWRFQNLIVNNEATKNVPVWYLRVSAKNCNVTITSYTAPVANGRDAWISYTVTGVGTQVIDNNYDRLSNWDYPGMSYTNYTVVIDGIERTENDGWTISDDGWVNITEAKSSVNIIYQYVYVGPIMPEPGGGRSNDVITIESILILIILVIVTIIIILFASRKLKKSRLKHNEQINMANLCLVKFS